MTAFLLRMKNHKKVLIIAVFAVLAGFSSAGKAANLRVDAYLSSTNVSEPVPIKANFDDWQTDDYESGDKLYSKHIARAGIGWDRWALGFTKQHYYYLNFSEDTALLHYLDKNDRLSQSKEVLQLDLRANDVEGQGAYLAYERPISDFTFSVTLNYLSLRKLMYGEAEGVFDPRKDLENTTRLIVDYAYHEDKIFDRPVTPPKGHGVTLDMAVHWQKHNHRVEWLVEELYSLFKWQSVPASFVSGTVNTLDSAGAASVQFRHFQSRIRQQLPSHSDLHYTYTLKQRFLLGAGWETLDRLSWHRLRVGWQSKKAGRLMLSFDPQSGLLGFAYTHPWVQFAIESDDSDEERSRILNLRLMTSVQFY